jgi:hypothetical protein
MTEEIKKPKEYALSDSEKELLQNINGMKFQYEYLASLLDRDITIILNTTIKKRLNIDDDHFLNLDTDMKKVYAIEKPKDGQKGEQEQNN